MILMTGIDRYHKYELYVDGLRVSEFYSRYLLSGHEMNLLGEEYAKDKFVTGVKCKKVRNDGCFKGEKIMPHYGRVA